MAESRAPARPISAAVPPKRPEYMRDTVASRDFGVVEKPLSIWQRLANQGWLRKALILTVIATVWELYARRLNNPLLVPTFTSTLEAFYAGMSSGELAEACMQVMHVCGVTTWGHTGYKVVDFIAELERSKASGAAGE